MWFLRLTLDQKSRQKLLECCSLYVETTAEVHCQLPLEVDHPNHHLETQGWEGEGLPERLPVDASYPSSLRFVVVRQDSLPGDFLPEEKGDYPEDAPPPTSILLPSLRNTCVGDLPTGPSLSLRAT
jgi:hypothetical protein